MTTARNLPYTSSVPVFVSGNHSFTTVCAGEAQSCALEPSGKAWCWGERRGRALVWAQQQLPLHWHAWIA